MHGAMGQKENPWGPQVLVDFSFYQLWVFKVPGIPLTQPGSCLKSAPHVVLFSFVSSTKAMGSPGLQADVRIRCLRRGTTGREVEEV